MLTHRDRQGLPLTTHSAQAASLYRDAIERVYGAEAGAELLLDQASAIDPGFGVAHVMRWMLAHASGDHAAALAREAALACRDQLTGWELGHLECMAALIERQPNAWASAREHLAAHPKNLLLAAHLVGDLFFHGGTGKRAAVIDVLEALRPHHDDDWAFQVRLGFHTSELGDPVRARELLENAFSVRPQAPYVAHAMVHTLLETGDRAAAFEFLRGWVARHDPVGSLDGHLHWHVALGELEHGRPEDAVARYQRAIAPGTSHCPFGLQLADAAGLFGRMTVDGLVPHDLPRATLHDLIDTVHGALGMPFVAIHVAALGLVLGEVEVIDRCIAAMEPVALGDTAYRVVLALRSYLTGDMRTCVEALEPDRARAWEATGGSNEERALIAKLHARASAQLAG